MSRRHSHSCLRLGQTTSCLHCCLQLGPNRSYCLAVILVMLFAENFDYDCSLVFFVAVVDVDAAAVAVDFDCK